MKKEKMLAIMAKLPTKWLESASTSGMGDELTQIEAHYDLPSDYGWDDLSEFVQDIDQFMAENGLQCDSNIYDNGFEFNFHEKLSVKKVKKGGN